MKTHAKVGYAVFALLILCLTTDAKELAEWGRAALDQEPKWYATAEARAVADRVLLYQSGVGAWPKDTDFLAPATAEIIESISKGSKANTLDNGATTLPLKFIALVASSTGGEKYDRAFQRGLDYLIASQYANGGWPQFYPLRSEGYYSRITYNDDAMMNVMFLLRDVAAGNKPYDFVDNTRRSKAADAVKRGIGCILNTQLKQDGTLTGWAAQYDEVSLEPAWARAYEPPSLSGAESVAIVRFLMELESPTTEQIAAIEGAVTWFSDVALYGIRYVRGPNAEGIDDALIVDDPTAGPIWARFYEIGSNRPIFLGRDSVVRYSLAEIETERRGGYAYYGDWPSSLIGVDFPRWQSRVTAIESNASTGDKLSVLPAQRR